MWMIKLKGKWVPSDLDTAARALAEGIPAKLVNRVQPSSVWLTFTR